MKGRKKTYTIFQLASAVVMILALLWLTVSTPFVYAAQQELAKHNKAVTSNPLSGAEEENNSNSLGNTTEEKIPADGNAATEEYLHNQYKDDYFCAEMLRSHECENMRIYIAFHSEILVPPPNAA